ncbi:MAG: serine hydrolase [Thermoplasmatales archaeon]|nr:MAG: serine hydrolase [Thermoplasmatales archaeon]
MKKKIVGILVCTLLIAPLILPVSGKITILTNIYCNEFYSENLLKAYGNFPINNELDEYIINKMSKNHIPGLSATIVKNDSIFWTQSYGYANLTSGQLVKDTTLFRLASVSKTVVATAIMQLYEQEYFDLHDPVNKYLPFQVIHPDYPSTNITFHMLMTHTSAIRDNWNVIPRIDGDPKIPLGEFLEEYLTPEGQFYSPTLNFAPTEPGTIWEYSNIGAALIGYLVEEISNMNFSDYCKNNIFQPLDMDETAWFLADLNISNIAVPYRWVGDDYAAYPHHCTNAYPAGNLRTSVTQLRNFLIMMIKNGTYNSIKILEESTVDLILSYQVSCNPFQGLIWRKMILYGKRTLWGHEGSYYGCRTNMQFEPKTNTGVIVLTNGQYDYIELREILSTLFDFADNKPPNEPGIEGPTSGKQRESYDYIFYTSDPEEHNVSYYVDWDDGSSTDWTEFVTSGTVITLTHKWSKQGVYIVKVKAKDSYDAESNWTELEVIIPKTGASSHLWYEWLLERFPLLERLLTLIISI